MGRQETAGVEGSSVVISVSGEEVGNRVFGPGSVFDNEIRSGEDTPPAAEPSIVRFQEVSAGEEFGEVAVIGVDMNRLSAGAAGEVVAEPVESILDSIQFLVMNIPAFLGVLELVVEEHHRSIMAVGM